MKTALLALCFLAAGCAHRPAESDPQLRLFRAALDGDVRAAKSALAAGADINGRDERSLGHTPLQIAMVEGREEMFIALVKWGAYVDARDAEGRTPLMLVARERLSLEYAKALVYPGDASLDLADNDGRTARQLAIESGYAELAEYLGSDLARAEKELAHVEAIDRAQRRLRLEEAERKVKGLLKSGQ